MTDLLTPRPIGGLVATPLGLGTARLGAFWQKRGVSEGLRTVETAMDLGVTLIDTADVYARGIAERLVGRAVARRPDVVVMTKVGLLKTPAGLRLAARHTDGPAPQLGGLRARGGADRCFAGGYVKAAAHACLQRQGRERLDVLLLHEPSASDLAQGAFLDAMNDLVTAGDVAHWGASVRDEDTARAALDVPGLTWLQLPANLADPSIAERVGPLAAERGIALIALAALGDGTLLPRTSAAGIRPQDAVSGLVEGAAALPGIDGVLLGMSDRRHVRDNLAGLQRGVPADVTDRLRAALSSAPPASEAPASEENHE